MIAELSAFRQDALREIGNIGLGGAVTALSEMTGVNFRLEVPEVLELTTAQLRLVCPSEECLMAGTIARVEGDWQGEAAFLFPWHSAQVLWQVLTGSSPSDLSELNELYESALREVANIMLGSFLTALSQLTGFELHMEPPAFAADMSAALMSSLMVEAMYGQRELLTIETRFCVPERQFEGFFFYLPETGSLQKLFEVLNI
ncbi:CheY-P phosphatase CheC [bacterium HR15]|nr:CheY-P phosphatase CheC [bacterium HR15]